MIVQRASSTHVRDLEIARMPLAPEPDGSSRWYVGVTVLGCVLLVLWMAMIWGMGL